MATTSITQELHDILFSENYAMAVELTDTDNCINSQELYHLRKYASKTCNLITTLLIDKKGQPVPSGIFELFMKYTGISPGSIRDNLLSWATEREEEICTLAKHYFKWDNLKFNDWYVKTSNVNKAIDKLCLFLLCQQHTRHAILVNRTSFWSTVNSAANVDKWDTCNKCDLGLLHLGKRKFALIENKSGYEIADTVNLIREYFNKKTANAKRKQECFQKQAECNIHQNRSKRQKKDVDYLEMNIGKGRAQPRSKP